MATADFPAPVAIAKIVSFADAESSVSLVSGPYSCSSDLRLLMTQTFGDYR
jgi:hypothetical protein